MPGIMMRTRFAFPGPTSKSQITSTKLQINHKFETPMTETASTMFSIHRGHPSGMKFEFWSLGFVCDLVFGAWDFQNFH
jgi:hypothetical protein